MIDKEKQIITLLKGNPLKFACEQLGINDMRGHSYSEVFTVSKEDVLEYVRKNGIPQDYSSKRYSLNDGFKFFEEDGKWYCCFRERGIITDDMVFENYDEGIVYITKLLLKLSGTGLF